MTGDWEVGPGSSWLDGMSPADFTKLVDTRRRMLAEQPAGLPLLALDPDPVNYLATTAAALLERRCLALGNPGWGSREREAALDRIGPCVTSGGEALGRAVDGIPMAREPLVLIPTGGTTGGLRLAVHTWETLAASADAFLRFLDAPPLVHLCALPLHHVSGFLQVVRAWRGGGRLSLASTGGIPAKLRAMEAGQPVVLSLVPTQLARLAEEGALDELRKARAVFLGGAAASLSLMEKAAQAGAPLSPCYGMTETAAMICALPPTDFLAGNRSCGLPLSHASVAIRDDGGRSLPTGKPGRVWVGASSLFHGYARGEAADTRNGWWASDDLGYLDTQGRLFLQGRIDDVIVTGGEKVSASFLERVILDSGLVGDALVAGVPDARWGERVVCGFEAKAVVNFADIEKVLRLQVARHFVPKQWMRLESLPRNAAGKPDRLALRALFQG